MGTVATGEVSARAEAVAQPGAEVETPDEAVVSEGGAEAGAEDPAPEASALSANRRGQRLGHLRRSLAGQRVLVALVLICLALAVPSGWLGQRLLSMRAVQADRVAATASAQRLAVSLTTISASSSEENIKQLLDGTTGSLKDQIVQSSGSLSQVLQSNGVTSTGTVVQTGVISLADGKASVLLAVDASVTSTTAATVQRHYRMLASVTKVGDRWLVSDMAFVP